MIKFSPFENISATKAAGSQYSTISNEHYIIYDHISQPIVDLIDLSCDQGSYIDVIKVSKTIPIVKGKSSELGV